MTLLTSVVFGLFLGMEHALDADHVVAVSAIVSESRSVPRSLLIGLVWGIGHTAALLLVGLFILFFGITVPPWVALSAEFLVGLVLILLGAQILWKYKKRRVHAHFHQHGDETHIHFHAHETTETHIHEHHGAHMRKPLLVGAAHGLAGSAAVMLLVLGSIRSPLAGALYVFAFSLGSILGMGATSALIGLPFLLTRGRFQRFHRTARLVAGLCSIILGCWISVGTFRLW